MAFMENCIFFNLNFDQQIADTLASYLNSEKGNLTLHKFPDGESSVCINSDFKNKKALLLASLHQPDLNILSLLFSCRYLKENGATQIILITPYLPYMRQDKAFKPGDAITSRYFAELISMHVDLLITIDPHLHRYHSLSEIYSIPCYNLSASQLIANWVQNNIVNPLLIGPDSESKQWIMQVARNINCPIAVLEKTRYGDKNVEIHFDDFEGCKKCTPVIIDDIISTASTMAVATKQLLQKGFTSPVCIGVHAVFADNAYAKLTEAGCNTIVTCNSIKHFSNKIEIGRAHV